MLRRRVELLAALAVLAPASLFAASSGCVDCHGNAETMKSLVPAPVVAETEGEG